MNHPADFDDPFRRVPGVWVDPPTTLMGRLKAWGPGLILTASVVGSGELIATTALGAKAGFAALWLILVSCLIKVPLQLLLGRYAIYSGQTTLHFFDQLPGPRYRASWFVLLWLLVLLMIGLQQGAMLGGVAMVLNIVFPGIDVWMWALVMAVVTTALLRRGHYARLERGSLVMVAIFTATTIACVGMLQGNEYRISAENIVSGLTWELPSGGLAVAVAVFGITGVGASELVFYPYVCLEKGYARCAGIYDHSDAWYARARGWIRTMHGDALLSMGIYTVLTLAFYLLGGYVLHARSAVPEGMEMVRNLSLMYTETLGEETKLVFLLGAFFALYSTVFVSTAANARMLTDCFQLLQWVKIDSYTDRLRWVRALVTVMPLVQFLLFLLFRQPLWMVVTGGMAQTASLIAIALGMLYLRSRKLDAGLRPSRTLDLLTWISACGIVLIADFGLLMTWLEQWHTASGFVMPTPSWSLR